MSVCSRLPILRYQTYTTRPARVPEATASAYVHVSDRHFDQLIASGQLLEHVEKYGYRYGSPRSLVNAGGSTLAIVELDPAGVAVLRSRTRRRVVSVFVSVQQKTEILERLVERDGEAGHDRLEDLERLFPSAAGYSYVLDSKSKESLHEDLYAIARSELARTPSTFLAEQGPEIGRRPVEIALIEKAGIIHDNRILRLFPAEKAHGTAFDLPGGRLMPGEDPASGLRREVLEETGLDVDVITPVRRWSFVEMGTQFSGTTWLCRASSSEVQLSAEHTRYEWLHEHDLSDGLRMRDELLAVFAVSRQGSCQPIRGVSRSFSSTLPDHR